MLTKKEWDSLTWKDRIDHIQDMYGFKNAHAMARELFGGTVKPTTIRSWKSGQKMPGKAAQQALFQFATGSDTPGRDVELTSVACETLMMDASVDAAAPVVGYVLAKRDRRQLFNTAHCILSRAIDITMAVSNFNLICSVHSVYGRYPFRAVATFTCVDIPDVKICIEVTHGEEVSTNFILRLSLWQGDKTLSEMAAVANDYGITRLAKKTADQLSCVVKTIKTKNHLYKK